MPLYEESTLEFISQATPIVIPGNLANYSARFIYNLANLLKDNEQAADALYTVEILEKKVEPFIFYHRKSIEHLKAVLLSHHTIQRWEDAIVLLRYLYADGYHFEEPEILTLLASNYKRKALYHPNGTLNFANQVDINLLQEANDLYEDAYNLSKTDKYYHAINQAYMMRIIDAIEGNGNRKRVEKEIESLYYELLKNNFPSDKSDWWQITTQVEFLLLIHKESDAIEVLDNYTTTPKPFEIESTIRQLNLYTHFTKDKVAKGLIQYLNETF